MSPGAVLLLLSTIAAPLPETPVYRWKFEKGKAIYQETVSNTSQVIKTGGSETVTKQRQTFVYRFTPTHQEGNRWVLRMAVEGIRWEYDIGGQKLTFDSTAKEGKDSSTPLAALYRAMLGWEGRLTLEDGKVVRLDGVAELSERIAKEGGELKGMQNLYTEDMLKEMATPSFNTLPGRRTAKGDSWSRVSRVDMGPLGRAVTTSEYVHIGKDDRYEKFEVTDADTKYELPAPAAGGALPFTLKKVEFKVKRAEGVILFDAERGRLVRSDLNYDMDGSLSIEIGGQLTDVTLSQTMKTSVRTTDGNPWAK